MFPLGVYTLLPCCYLDKNSTCGYYLTLTNGEHTGNNDNDDDNDNGNNNNNSDNNSNNSREMFVLINNYSNSNNINVVMFRNSTKCIN